MKQNEQKIVKKSLIIFFFVYFNGSNEEDRSMFFSHLIFVCGYFCKQCKLIRMLKIDYFSLFFTSSMFILQLEMKYVYTILV